MNRIELVEETDLSIPKEQISGELAGALYRDSRFELDSPPDTDVPYRLRSKGWVGHIPIGETLFVVQPKAPISSIFGMLEVAYQLESFNILDGKTAVETLDEIYERVASILAQRVNDRVRKGLYRSYVEQNEDLQFVRGRIDIRGNVRNALVGAPRLRCHFEELTVDLEENVILLWALFSASRLGVRRDDVKLQIRRAYRSLVGAVSLDPKTAQDCVGRFYHRLNNDYRPMHGLARFLIEHSGPGIDAGGHEFVPFSINMPNLFESFVTELLKRELPGELKIDAQYRVQLNANAVLEFRIDLVIRDRKSGNALSVLDTKYKMKDKPRSEDLHQVISYAVELGVTRAYLIYPFSLSSPVKVKVGNVDVETVGVDLNRSSATFGQDLVSSLVTDLAS